MDRINKCHRTYGDTILRSCDTFQEYNQYNRSRLLLDPGSTFRRGRLDRNLFVGATIVQLLIHFDSAQFHKTFVNFVRRASRQVDCLHA